MGAGVTEAGCYCTCPREISVTVEHLSAGSYTLEIVIMTGEGEASQEETFSFECIESPNDWAYNGVACIA